MQITQIKSEIKSFDGMFFFEGIPLTIAPKHAALEEQMTMAMMAEADGDKFVIGPPKTLPDCLRNYARHGFRGGTVL